MVDRSFERLSYNDPPLGQILNRDTHKSEYGFVETIAILLTQVSRMAIVSTPLIKSTQAIGPFSWKTNSTSLHVSLSTCYGVQPIPDGQPHFIHSVVTL